MDINQALGQIRPLLSIAGSIIIAAIGWLIKGI